VERLVIIRVRANGTSAIARLPDPGAFRLVWAWRGPSFEWKVRHREADMRQIRFTEGNVIAIPATHERGVPTADNCRKHGPGMRAAR
jgi:hypothetical protein